MPVTDADKKRYADYAQERLVKREGLKKVCRTISEDMAADAKAFDGQPFNGRTVAEYFGNQGAAIDALARIIVELLTEE